MQGIRGKRIRRLNLCQPGVSLSAISLVSAVSLVKMLLHFSLLLSSACSLSQTGGDERIITSDTHQKSISGDRDTCDKSISSDINTCDRSEIVNSCQRKENDVSAEEEKIVPSRMEEERKGMQWHELDWAAYQALDINPADRDEPTAR